MIAGKGQVGVLLGNPVDPQVSKEINGLTLNYFYFLFFYFQLHALKKKISINTEKAVGQHLI